MPSIQAHLHRCRKLWRNTWVALLHTDHHKTPAPDYQSGQKVWLLAKDLPLKVEAKKLAPCMLVPTKSTPLLLTSNCPTPYGSMPHSMSPLKPVSTSILGPPAKPHLLTQVMDNHPAYTVKCLLDVCHQGCGFQYLVDWDGYSPEEQSWAPRSFILDPMLIRDIHRAHPDKPGIWRCLLKGVLS